MKPVYQALTFRGVDKDKIPIFSIIVDIEACLVQRLKVPLTHAFAAVRKELIIRFLYILPYRHYRGIPQISRRKCFGIFDHILLIIKVLLIFHLIGVQLIYRRTGKPFYRVLTLLSRHPAGLSDHVEAYGG